MRGLILLILIALTSCGRHAEDSIVAQMRVRNMQSRTFAFQDSKKVSKEVIAILQDQGYMVKSVSHELGVITAELDTNIERFSSKFWAYLFSGKNARWKKHSVVEITSNITEDQGRTKVRINLLVRVFDNLGRVVNVHQILDEQAYIDFFNQLQRGLLAS